MADLGYVGEPGRRRSLHAGAGAPGVRPCARGSRCANDILRIPRARGGRGRPGHAGRPAVSAARDRPRSARCSPALACHVRRRRRPEPAATRARRRRAGGSPAPTAARAWPVSIRFASSRRTGPGRARRPEAACVLQPRQDSLQRRRADPGVRDTTTRYPAGGLDSTSIPPRSVRRRPGDLGLRGPRSPRACW